MRCVLPSSSVHGATASGGKIAHIFKNIGCQPLIRGIFFCITDNFIVYRKGKMGYYHSLLGYRYYFYSISS